MESSPGPARRRSARAPATPTCTVVPGLLAGLTTKLLSLTKVCAAPPPAAEAAATTTKPGDPGPDPRLVLVMLFDAVSSLKSGYARHQRAHFPSYDADTAAAAAEAVASELDSVAALQCLVTSNRGIGPLVDDRWARAQQLEAQARRMDAHIAKLRRELRRLRRDNARLSKQVAVSCRSRNDDGHRRGALPLSVPTELLATPAAALVSLFVAASRSVGDFADLLAPPPPPAGSSRGEPCVVIGGADADQAARWWRRYALEAHVWRAMLLAGGGGEEFCACPGDGDAGGLSRSSFRRIMRPRDALDALMQFPGSGLAAFCGAAYLAAVPPAAEACGGNLDTRAFVSRGGHPRTPLYRAFAAAARSVWALRVLMARCSRPEMASGGGGGVSMFYARRGSVYAAEFMETVLPAVGDGGDCCVEESGEEEKVIRVAFTVTPGVKVGDTVVPCRVLLCRRRREGFAQI